MVALAQSDSGRARKLGPAIIATLIIFIIVGARKNATELVQRFMRRDHVPAHRMGAKISVRATQQRADEVIE
jgi:hypothetical protein